MRKLKFKGSRWHEYDRKAWREMGGEFVEFNECLTTAQSVWTRNHNPLRKKTWKVWP